MPIDDAPPTPSPSGGPGSGPRPGSADFSWSAVYDELKQLAHHAIAGEKTQGLLRTTSLVHEAYVKLEGDKPTQWNSPGHFFTAAAKAMRQILVDEARRRKALKRGGDRIRIAIDDVQPSVGESSFDIIDLDDALEALSKIDPRAARVVELRFFAGCSVKETAATLGCGIKDVDKDWEFAKAWLRTRMGPTA